MSFQLNSPKSFLPAQQSRTFLAKLTRKSPAAGHATRTASPSVDVPASQTPAPPLQLTNLPYFVRRTSSNQLPVYLVTKAGGTKQLTKIQRTEGDLEALRTDLGRALGLECRKSKKINDVTINQLNGHIIVKVRVHLDRTSLYVCSFDVDLSSCSGLAETRDPKVSLGTEFLSMLRFMFFYPRKSSKLI